MEWIFHLHIILDATMEIIIEKSLVPIYEQIYIQIK